MQRSHSPRRLLWRGASLALMLAAMPLALAQKTTVGLMHGAKPASSPASATSAPLPKVDTTSLSSVEQYVAALHKQARLQALKNHNLEADREKNETKATTSRATKTAGKVSPKKSKYLVHMSGGPKQREEMLERNTVGEYWDSYLYWLRPRVFPGNQLDTTVFARAASARDRMDQVPPKGIVAPKAGAPVPSWSTIGPPGFAGSSTTWRISGITYDPENPNRYFAAGSRGGVWQSDDRGINWIPIMEAPPDGTGSTYQPMLPVSCVAVDIRDSNTIFIGTGEYDSPGPGFGLLKGHWDGTQWVFNVKGAAQFGTQPIHHITTDPNTQSKLFATAGNKGLFLSTDTGETWTEVLGPDTTPAVTGSFSNCVYNSYGDIIYACADGPGGGIFQSTNGGVTWSAVPGAPSPSGRIDIAASTVVSPRGRKTLYAVLPNERLVYKGAPPGRNGGPPGDGDNGAQTWTTLDNFPKTAPGARNIWDQSTFYNLAIACTTAFQQVTVIDTATPPNVATVTEDVVIVALLDLHISQDSGRLWRSGAQGDIDFPYNRVLQEVPGYHTDHHALAISPFNPQEFLTGCDGGVNRITFAPLNEPAGPQGGIHQQIPQPVPNPLPTPPLSAVDAALYTGPNSIFKRLATYTRTPINSGLGIAQFYFTGHHPTNPNVGLGGTQDNGSVYSFGSPNTWNEVSNGGDGGGCGINQFNPNIQFISNYVINDPFQPPSPFYPVTRTPNSWGIADDVSLYIGDDISAFFSTANISRSNPNVFYMSTNYLYEYDERIQDWRKFRQQFSPLGTVSAISTTPASLKYLYVGTTDGTVWVSMNADQDPNPELVTFRRIDRQGLPGGLPTRSVTGISASALDPKRVTVSLSGLGQGHVFRCNDVTAASPQWINLTSNLPDIFTNCVEVLPRNNDAEIAVGTDVGAFYTNDSGTTWHNISSTLSLPNVQVNTLWYTPGTGLLNSGTFGRGMWHIDLSSPLTVFNNGGGGGGGGPQISPFITLVPYLQDYGGSRSKLAINVQIFQGTTLVQTVNKQLDAGGKVTFTLANTGTYDFLITVPGFLHKRISNLIIKTATATFQPQLINGDVNRDNAITIADLTAAQRRLNQYTTGPEDVNGDGRVTQADIDIITKNLGKVGDN